jgi:hypothetical protein
MDNIVLGQLTLSALFLALLPVYLNHFFANTRDKTKIRREEGKVLTKALQPELDALIQTSQDCRLILTDDAYRKHESAIRCFMIYLSWVDKLRLRRLWHRLAMIKIWKKQHIQFYEQYADCGSLYKRKTIRPVVIKRIQDIISFANK